MGARIEIKINSEIIKDKESLPSWERGLKYIMNYQKFYKSTVAPLVGARIEISFYERLYSNVKSLPSWERGLKSDLRREYDDAKASLPSWERGLKSEKMQVYTYCVCVAPLVGARIEI